MIRIPKKKTVNAADEENTEALPRSEKLSFGSTQEPSGDEARATCRTSHTTVKSENPALSAAYRILQSGANSRKMLRDKLMKKGFSKDEANTAIAFCEKEGLLHEKRLFVAHTEFLARKKHYGKSRIFRELLLKFDRQTVEDYFDEAISEIDFEAYANAEAERSCHRGKRYVQSRLHTLGYSSHEIYEAVDGLSFETETFDT